MKEKLGLIHIYFGDGKGKTTAAIGVITRALGAGLRCLVLQFLKKGSSSEVSALKNMGDVRVVAVPDINGFLYLSDDNEREKCRKIHNENLLNVIKTCNSGEVDVVLFDEVLDAADMGLLDYDIFINFIKSKPKGLEILITGRNPADKLIDMADYVSEIKKIKHPYDKGIAARNGIDK